MTLVIVSLLMNIYFVLIPSFGGHVLSGLSWVGLNCDIYKILPVLGSSLRASTI